MTPGDFDDDHHRDPRLAPGWWILPGALAGLLIIIALIRALI